MYIDMDMKQALERCLNREYSWHAISAASAITHVLEKTNPNDRRNTVKHYIYEAKTFYEECGDNEALRGLSDALQYIDEVVPTIYQLNVEIDVLLFGLEYCIEQEDIDKADSRKKALLKIKDYINCDGVLQMNDIYETICSVKSDITDDIWLDSQVSNLLDVCGY